LVELLTLPVFGMQDWHVHRPPLELVVATQTGVVMPAWPSSLSKFVKALARSKIGSWENVVTYASVHGLTHRAVLFQFLDREVEPGEPERYTPKASWTDSEVALVYSGGPSGMLPYGDVDAANLQQAVTTWMGRWMKVETIVDASRVSESGNSKAGLRELARTMYCATCAYTYALTISQT